MSRGVDAEGEYERAGKFMMKQGPAGISALGDVGHAWNCTIYCDWRLPSGESMGQDRNHGERERTLPHFLIQSLGIEISLGAKSHANLIQWNPYSTLSLPPKVLRPTNFARFNLAIFVFTTT
jgi:hypothetical protein